MKVAVAGGTGTVGRYVVEAARDRGLDITLLTRSSGVDLITGKGLRPALEGVDAVIDVSNLTTLSAKKATSFFTTVTTNLLRAEREASIGHHVALSVVGIDAIDSSYYAGKLAQERAIDAFGMPYTLMRAGQFHEFAEQVLEQTTIAGLSLIPKTLMRPVAARDVARRLVGAAEGGPAGRIADFVGPRDETLIGVVRRMFRFDHAVRRGSVEVRIPGSYGRGLASGSLRGGANRVESSMDFDAWLRTADHRTVR